MFKKLIVVVLALIVLVVVGLQLFLQYGLTDSLRKYVLPAARERLQVDVAMEKVSVNLLAGSFSVRGVKVANPPGFQEPDMALLKKFSVKIGIPALLKGGVAEIHKAVVKGGVMTVVRNRDGVLNIEPLLGVRKEAGSAPGPAGQPAPPAAEQPVNVMVKTMEIGALVRYVDYQVAGEPFRLALDLQAKLKDVANYGNEDVLSGTISLLGTFQVEDKKCAFDLNGQISPVVDPLRLSFDVSGSMQEVDLKAFHQLIRKHGIEGGTVRGTATLRCKKGVFDPDKSVLRLTLSKIQLAEEQRAKIPGGRLPESLAIMVPIQGTLERPAIDFDEVLKRTLLSPDMIGSVLQSVLQDRGKGGAQAASESVDKAKPDTAGEVKKAAESAPKDATIDVNQSVKDIFGP